MSTAATRTRRKGRRPARRRAGVVVRSDPGILGGTPVFVGTRVPFRNLIDYLAAGDSLDEFLEDFPGVTRAQAVAGLKLARTLAEDDARSAR